MITYTYFYSSSSITTCSRSYSQETVLTIKDAAEALETARYVNFWSMLNSRGPVFAAIPTWKDDIRKSKFLLKGGVQLCFCYLVVLGVFCFAARLPPYLLTST